MVLQIVQLDPTTPIMVLSDTIWTFLVLNLVLYLLQSEAPEKVLGSTFFLRVCPSSCIFHQLLVSLIASANRLIVRRGMATCSASLSRHRISHGLEVVARCQPSYHRVTSELPQSTSEQYRKRKLLLRPWLRLKPMNKFMVRLTNSILTVIQIHTAPSGPPPE